MTISMPHEIKMPTTFWFLRMLALAALLVYAAMHALVWAVHPRQTEFSEPIAINLPPPPPEPAETPPADAGPLTGTVSVDPAQ